MARAIALDDEIQRLLGRLRDPSLSPADRRAESLALCTLHRELDALVGVDSPVGGVWATLPADVRTHLAELFRGPGDAWCLELLERQAVSYVQQGRAFEQLAGAFGFVASHGLGVHENRAALVLTQSGSLVQLSAPGVEGDAAARRYVYQNIYGNPTPRESSLRLRGPIAVGRRLAASNMTTSSVREVRLATRRESWEQQRETFRCLSESMRLVPFAPFEDASFDFVTCQTLLIHLAEPRRAIAEMVRVVRPGGRIAVAEPNNIAGALVLDVESLGAPVEEIVERLRFQLLCERGKIALGEGNNSLGGAVPALFAEAGLERIGAFQCDKVKVLLPPYASDEERAEIDEILSRSTRDYVLWPRDEARRWYEAGGGRDFDAAWEQGRALATREARAIRENRYASIGSGALYLIEGIRPRV